MSELVAGIRHGDRRGPGRDDITRENIGSLGVAEPQPAPAQFAGQRPVEKQKPRRPDRHRLHPRMEIIRQPRIGVVELNRVKRR